MRDARSQSASDINLAPFAISLTPVTVAQYATQDVAGFDKTQTTDSAHAHPVHGITWFDAITWCNASSRRAGLNEAYRVEAGVVTWHVEANGFRLPTEAEWEFACRAGTTSPTYGKLEDIAWTAADSVTGPQPVAQKQPNAFGLFDTIGNVWEWCWNYADTARYGDYRSIRGGGWADREWSCRASVRRGSAPNAILEDVGFRVALGAVGRHGELAGQGWSDEADRDRARVVGPRPIGWTPLTFRDEPDRD